MVKATVRDGAVAFCVHRVSNIKKLMYNINRVRLLLLVIKLICKGEYCMCLRTLHIENYSAFRNLDIDFCKGVNVFIGENGTGKTHLMKLLYSACQAADQKTSFSQKLVNCILPDDYKISHLVHKGTEKAFVDIQGWDEEDGVSFLKMYFSNRTKKWDARVVGEEDWEFALGRHNSVFIPAKEILSNSYNLNAAVAKNNVKFDDTYLDVLNSAKIDVSNDSQKDSCIYDIPEDDNPKHVCEMLPVYMETTFDGSYINKCFQRNLFLQPLEKIIGGTVFYDDKKDTFYIKKSRRKEEFNLVAEGIRKLALLWQLINNGALNSGAVLFWDEPEANINPAHIATVAEILLALQRMGVQIFISTHDYVLAKYLEIRKDKYDEVLFHSFNKVDNDIAYEYGTKFGEIKNNMIVKSFDALLNEIYDLGD